MGGGEAATVGHAHKVDNAQGVDAGDDVDVMVDEGKDDESTTPDEELLTRHEERDNSGQRLWKAQRLLDGGDG